MTTETNIHQNKAQQNIMDQYDALMTWYSKSIQLRRLLHCMTMDSSQSSLLMKEQEYTLSSWRRPQEDFETNNSAKGFNLYRVVQQQQIIEARSMLSRISREAEYLMNHVETTQDQYREILGILQDLQVSVENACVWVHENLNEECSQNDIDLFDLDSAARLINHVFYDDVQSLEQEQGQEQEQEQEKFTMGTLSDTASSGNNEESHCSYHAHDSSSSRKHVGMNDTPNKALYGNTNNDTFATQQCPEEEEILQEEISDMAAQLKESSLQIKSTLASQNKNLQNIEMLAQENLSKTSQVAQNVTQHVSAGWKHSFRKWFVFFMVLGTWFFCFLTIRMVPKKKTQGVSCVLWFCNKSSTGRSSTVHDRHDVEYDDNDGDHHDDDVMVRAKYSYCQEYSHGAKSARKQKQCTVPLHAQDHMQSIGKLFNSSESFDAGDVAERIVEQNKGKRMEYHYNRARLEDDNVAASRIKEGWESVVGVDADVTQDDTPILLHQDVKDENGIHWTKETRQQQQPIKHQDTVKYTRNDVKRAIFQNDLKILETIMESNPELAKLRDENGWEVLHEAVRKGSVEATAILLNSGYANIDAQVGASGQGGSVLWIAKHLHGGNHEIIQYLRERGATEIPPNSNNNNNNEL